MHALSQKMLETFNNQMNGEFFASYLYLAMSAYFDAHHLDGFSAYFREKSDEERLHALKIYEHIVQRHGEVVFRDIKAPPSSWATPIAAFEEAYQQESAVTSAIHQLMAQARKESDYASEVFLQWFVAEQIQEETEIDAILGKLRMTEGNPAGMLLLDDKFRPTAGQKAGPA